MNNKVFLDEAGLGEVGKVIKEHYASKEDLNKIDVAQQLVGYAKNSDLDSKVDKVDGKVLSTNDYTNDDKKSMDDWRKKLFIEQVKHHVGDSITTDNYTAPDIGLLTGSYFMKSDEVVRHDDQVLVNGAPVLFEPGNPQHDLIAKLTPLGGVYCLETHKLNKQFEEVKSDAQECYIEQVIRNITTGISFARMTLQCKREYSDNYIIEDMKANSLTVPNGLNNQNWTVWRASDGIPLALSITSADSEEAGLMLPEDKRKLDSINDEVINANTIKVCDVEKKF